MTINMVRILYLTIISELSFLLEGLGNQTPLLGVASIFFKNLLRFQDDGGISPPLVIISLH